MSANEIGLASSPMCLPYNYSVQAQPEELSSDPNAQHASLEAPPVVAPQLRDEPDAAHTGRLPDRLGGPAALAFLGARPGLQQAAAKASQSTWQGAARLATEIGMSSLRSKYAVAAVGLGVAGYALLTTKECGSSTPIGKPAVSGGEPPEKPASTHDHKATTVLSGPPDTATVELAATLGLDIARIEREVAASVNSGTPVTIPAALLPSTKEALAQARNHVATLPLLGKERATSERVVFLLEEYLMLANQGPLEHLDFQFPRGASADEIRNISGWDMSELEYMLAYRPELLQGTQLESPPAHDAWPKHVDLLDQLGLYRAAEWLEAAVQGPQSGK